MDEICDKNILYSSLPEKFKHIQDEESTNVVYKWNLQKNFYDIKLEDIKGKIERLEIRNEEILDDLEMMEFEYNNTDIETTNIIADLNRQLNSEMNKIEDCVNKLNAMERWRVEEQFDQSNKMNNLEERYENTKNNITCLLKVLNAKINVLEEYKIDEDSLQDKLKSRDNAVNENEENLQRAIQDIHRRFQIDTDKLKSEMYDRLLGLAGTFQIDVARRMHTPIHRLMRDNIILNKNLTLIRKNDDAKHFKTIIKRNRAIIQKNNNKTKRHLIVDKVQDSLIKFLKDIPKKRLVDFKSSPDKLDRFTREMNYCNFHIKTIEGFLYREQVELNLAKATLMKLKCKLKECFNTLYDLKYTVSCGLQEVDDDSTTIELAQELFNIMKKGRLRMKNMFVGSCESIPRPETIYPIGDLGFEPEHVNVYPAISAIDPIEEFFMMDQSTHDTKEEYHELKIDHENHEEIEEEYEDDI